MPRGGGLFDCGALVNGLVLRDGCPSGLFDQLQDGGEIGSARVELMDPSILSGVLVRVIAVAADDLDHDGAVVACGIRLRYLAELRWWCCGIVLLDTDGDVVRLSRRLSDCRRTGRRAVWRPGIAE